MADFQEEVVFEAFGLESMVIQAERLDHFSESRELVCGRVASMVELRSESHSSDV